MLRINLDMIRPEHLNQDYSYILLANGGSYCKNITYVNHDDIIRFISEDDDYDITGEITVVININDSDDSIRPCYIINESNYTIDFGDRTVMTAPDEQTEIYGGEPLGIEDELEIEDEPLEIEGEVEIRDAYLESEFRVMDMDTQIISDGSSDIILSTNNDDVKVSFEITEEGFFFKNNDVNMLKISSNGDCYINDELVVHRPEVFHMMTKFISLFFEINKDNDKGNSGHNDEDAIIEF